MMIITDVRPGEPDILAGRGNEPLLIKDLCGTVLTTVQTTVPWTDKAIRDAVASANIENIIQDAGGADAYIGDLFVGSTEC